LIDKSVHATLRLLTPSVSIHDCLTTQGIRTQVATARNKPNISIRGWH